MESEIELFYSKMPELMPLGEAVKDKIMAAFKKATFKVFKTQISFYSEKTFALLWLPLRKVKNRPEKYVILSFLLDRQIASPRIVQAAEPYPGHWTHHLIIEDAAQIDDEMMEWLKQSASYARKRVEK